MAQRVTQVAVEVLVIADNSKARTTQVAVEALALSNTRNARVTQVVAEVLVKPASGPPARSQGYIIG